MKLAVEQETAADTLTVVLPDRTIEFTPEVTNVALNPDEAADAAMNYGRDGGPIKALITYQKAKRTGRISRWSPARIWTRRISAT